MVITGYLRDYVSTFVKVINRREKEVHMENVRDFNRFHVETAIETQLSNLAPMPDILDKTLSHYRQGKSCRHFDSPNKSIVGRDHVVSPMFALRYVIQRLKTSGKRRGIHFFTD